MRVKLFNSWLNGEAVSWAKANKYASIFSNYLMAKGISSGTVHKVPADLRKSLLSSRAVQAAWNGLTPLARNEWICWVTYVKKPETRQNHVKRVCSELLEGMHRPCCWPGCPHR
jgi:hypothetical protein